MLRLNLLHYRSYVLVTSQPLSERVTKRSIQYSDRLNICLPYLVGMWIYDYYSCLVLRTLAYGFMNYYQSTWNIHWKVKYILFSSNKCCHAYLVCKSESTYVWYYGLWLENYVDIWFIPFYLKYSLTNMCMLLNTVYLRYIDSMIYCLS